MKKAEPEVTRTIYPRLPDIPDLETLELVTAVEEEELEYISQFETDRKRYFVLLYIKAMSYLGHSRFQPGDLPRLMRVQLARALKLPSHFARIREIPQSEKDEHVSDAGEFLHLTSYTRTVERQAQSWLTKEVACKEGDPVSVINALILWFKNSKVELPPFSDVAQITARALKCNRPQEFAAFGR